MNDETRFGYVALWKGKQIEVRASTALEAQTKAAQVFKAKKAYEVSVYLCERPDGTPVVRDGSEL
jgi:hypothetical protein